MNTTTDTPTWQPPAPFTNAYRVGHGSLPEGFQTPPFEPVGDTIVAQRVHRELTTKGGVVLTEASRQSSQEALILAVGPQAGMVMQYDVDEDTPELTDNTPIALSGVLPGYVVRTYRHCGRDEDVTFEDGEEREVTYLKAEDIVGIVARPA